MTRRDFLFCFSRFSLSMQLVAGKVQRQYRQSKTLNLHTAVETPCESVKDETKRDRGKASGSLLNVSMLKISQSFSKECKMCAIFVIIILS